MCKPLPGPAGRASTWLCGYVRRAVRAGLNPLPVSVDRLGGGGGGLFAECVGRRGPPDWLPEVTCVSLGRARLRGGAGLTRRDRGPPPGFARERMVGVARQQDVSDVTHNGTCLERQHKSLIQLKLCDCVEVHVGI